MAHGQSVVFSHPAGYYADSFQLALTPSSQLEEGYTIRYTLNGFDPKANSRLYVAPIPLDTSCFSEHRLYAVRNCPPSLWNPPDTVAHIIVVRAAIFDPMGTRISSIQTASYFIQMVSTGVYIY